VSDDTPNIPADTLARAVLDGAARMGTDLKSALDLTDREFEALSDLAKRQRTAWTVIGQWTQQRGNQCIGAVRGHVMAYGEDPIGIETWAEWVWGNNPDDCSDAYNAALAIRGQG
jgi:hypothetical protein